ncbi:sulfur carrier protein ThiS adenylyltransferase ThiF [Sporomusa acidovorans]|uniref:Molybdopterin-synthase adenylyltransferase n=1 Tax=Sporomusa acidovorans (strain ATCC 49682 / DSM 3132 / Mol) TaxID=1123286 RepID=A0ABZ3J8C8_SPOA4|nr:sulfur carrier protein ThiS adenylyltransferase ThiF [Sporomusa acidovorans]OZC24120.1 putative adenylyltransferase/sulfurtransferase MoeZ [Sporomusa acidovorans DSM 3132]SDF71847.1 sulfur carrier protein ThiS adenylyltransferase [Sporomusa acidovorans]
MQVEINGRRQALACHTVFEARSQFGGATDVVILNGFQIDSDHPLAEGDTLTLIRKGAMPSREELESMMMARHTPTVHKKVKQGRVAIAGLGGLGSNIAVMLARIGVGKLLLVDFDIVEPSNLNRQSYYIRHLGMPKTQALQSQLAEINPFIQVETRTVRVDAENVPELFGDYEVLCEAFDKPDAKAMLVNTALDKLPDIKIVAASGMAGYASSNLIKTAKPLARLFVCGDLENGAAIGRGLMAPRVQICAGHQANMVLRLLVGMEEI